MNVDDVLPPSTIPSWPETLHQVFARQAELMEKYRIIEQLPSPPVSLHHASGQRVIKDFAWRVTEELTESYQALLVHQNNIGVMRSHAIEELADALHFFVELLIFAGITPEQVLGLLPHWPNRAPMLKPAPTAFWDSTYYLGVAMNFLRNKAWKQSQVSTDEGRFREALLQAFVWHIDLWAVLVPQEDLFNFYFRKSEVNKFRQRTHY